MDSLSNLALIGQLEDRYTSSLKQGYISYYLAGNQKLWSNVILNSFYTQPTAVKMKFNQNYSDQILMVFDKASNNNQKTTIIIFHASNGTVLYNFCEDTQTDGAIRYSTQSSTFFSSQGEVVICGQSAYNNRINMYHIKPQDSGFFTSTNHFATSNVDGICKWAYMGGAGKAIYLASFIDNKLIIQTLSIVVSPLNMVKSVKIDLDQSLMAGLDQEQLYFSVYEGSNRTISGCTNAARDGKHTIQIVLVTIGNEYSTFRIEDESQKCIGNQLIDFSNLAVLAYSQVDLAVNLWMINLDQLPTNYDNNFPYGFAHFPIPMQNVINLSSLEDQNVCDVNKVVLDIQYQNGISSVEFTQAFPFSTKFSYHLFQLEDKFTGDENCTDKQRVYSIVDQIYNISDTSLYTKTFDNITGLFELTRQDPVYAVLTQKLRMTLPTLTKDISMTLHIYNCLQDISMYASPQNPLIYLLGDESQTYEINQMYIWPAQCEATYQIQMVSGPWSDLKNQEGFKANSNSLKLKTSDSRAPGTYTLKLIGTNSYSNSNQGYYYFQLIIGCRLTYEKIQLETSFKLPLGFSKTITYQNLQFKTLCPYNVKIKTLFNGQTRLPKFIKSSETSLSYRIFTLDPNDLGKYQFQIYAEIQDLNRTFDDSITWTLEIIENQNTQIKNKYPPQFTQQLKSQQILVGQDTYYTLPLITDQEQDKHEIILDIEQSSLFTQYDSDQRHVMLKFEYPYEISMQEISDQIQVKFEFIFKRPGQRRNLAISKQQRLKLYVIRSTLPPQIDQEDKEIMDQAGEAVQQAIKYGLGSNFFLQFFLSQTLSVLWSAINNLQLLVHLVLFDFKIPANVQYFLLMLVDISNLNLMPDNQYITEALQLDIKSLNSLDQEWYIFNEEFQILGYEYILYTTFFQQTIVLLGAGIIIVLIDRLFAQQICNITYFRHSKLQRLYHNFTQSLYFSYFLRLMIETFFGLSLLTIYNLKNKFEISDWRQLVNTLIAILSAAFIFLLPIILWIFLYRNQKQREKAKFDKHFSSLQENVNLYRDQTFLVIVFYLLRRLIYVLAMFFLTYQTQLLALFLQSFLILLYFAAYRPMSTPLHNFLEFMNELTFLSTAIYLNIIYSDFVSDSYIKYIGGWCFVYIVLGNIGINFLVMIFMVVRAFIQWE
eukprot:403355191